jgi:DNA repair protein RadC
MNQIALDLRAVEQHRPKRIAGNRIAALSPHGLSEEECASVIALALAILEARHAPGQPIESPQNAADYLRLRLAEEKNERFGVIFFDNRYRILSDEVLFYGTIDGASVHPRVVVQRALELNAAAVIFYHNHPSGVAEPSAADRALTQRLREILGVVDVRVLDHWVVSSQAAVSFAQRGLL